jgi:hypothetical protein
MSGRIASNTLILTFSPALLNAKTYRIDIGPTVTSVAGQQVFVRGLIGDANGDGFVNATDRSVVVGAWTGPGGFSCPTDVNNDGLTNATDRSVVVGAWTGGAATNCAP